MRDFVAFLVGCVLGASALALTAPTKTQTQLPSCTILSTSHLDHWVTTRATCSDGSVIAMSKPELTTKTFPPETETP